MNNIILLHGALGDKTQFENLEKRLSNDYHVYTINFSGHGGKTIPAVPFSIKLFADDVLALMKINRIESADIFGYSMGGYVGVYLAMHSPEKVNRVFTLGTKFRWNGEISAREVKLLDPYKIKVKIPKFYYELVEKHAPQSIETILEKTAEMMHNLCKNNELKPEDYTNVQHEIMVGVGDRDNMVTLDETNEVYRKLQKGRLIVLPDTPHPFEGANEGRLVWEIKNFFN